MRKLIALAITAVIALTACGYDPYNTGDPVVIHHHHVVHQHVTHHTVVHHHVTIRKTTRSRSLSFKKR
jgi:hypothetical protein